MVKANVSPICRCPTGAIRLEGSTSQNEGRVEVCIDRQWGTICDDKWDEVDAQVACTQLGYRTNG